MATRETLLGTLMRGITRRPRAPSVARCVDLFPVARALWEKDNALQRRHIQEAQAREAQLMQEHGVLVRNDVPDSAHLRALVFTKP